VEDDVWREEVDVDEGTTGGHAVTTEGTGASSKGWIGGSAGPPSSTD
jgi:hypothetical protein